MYLRQAHTAITHTAASVGVNSADYKDPLARGLIVGINIATITGTAPTLTVTIQGKDPHSGTYYTLLASAALVAAGYTELIVMAGTTVAAGVAASRPMPIDWRVITAIGGTTPAVTATISAQTVF